MKKSVSKNELVAIKVYFKTSDKTQMEVYRQVQELSKSIGVSLSTAAGMSLRRGVPLVRGDWNDIMPKSK